MSTDPNSDARGDGNLKRRYQLIYELWKLYVRRYMAEDQAKPEEAMSRAYADLVRRGLLQAQG